MANSALADLLPSLIAFRRDIHAHPELGFKEYRTSARIADALRAIGLEVHTGIGGTGLVGVLRNGASDRKLALRSDMDALPIQEDSGRAYASGTAGIMHACGHDGHIAMLLGAATHLARTKTFDGTVVFIFQPAEEGLGGARKMIADGLFDRFPADQVYALHNWPDLPAGSAATRPGAIMAAADRFEIGVEGKGGHAAMPHQTPDAILAAADLVSQLNTIVARRIPATESAVLSITQIHGGHAHNVLPTAVQIVGTVRSFNSDIQDVIEAAVRQIGEGVARASGTRVVVHYDRYYPATINDSQCSVHALDAARCVCGRAEMAQAPAFTSEDFAFMLQARKGAYLWLGQGPDERRGGQRVPLHHPSYDFNDDIIASGAGWYIALTEMLLAA